MAVALLRSNLMICEGTGCADDPSSPAPLPPDGAASARIVRGPPGRMPRPVVHSY